MSEGLDITKLVKEVMNDTMDRDFYLQAKAFFEKNNEHITEIAKLKAEVERLRKAGDAMANALNLDDDVFDNHDKKEAQSNWNAAKDGKPSA
jgi:hypothetical protein